MRHPGKNQIADSPSVYESPTVPKTAQALSELAVEEIAVTHAFKERSARKKSNGDRVWRDAIHPMPSIIIK